MLDALEVSLTLLELTATLEAKVRTRRRTLAEQLGRAADSIALNIGEGRQRAGLDRTDLYRRAAGSAAELDVALRIARARGCISARDYDAAFAPLDRVRAMLWRLTH